MSRFTLKWVDGQYKVSMPGIETMDVVPAADFDELLGALQGLFADTQDPMDAATSKWWHDKARALIAKHGGGV